MPFTVGRCTALLIMPKVPIITRILRTPDISRKRTKVSKWQWLLRLLCGRPIDPALLDQALDDLGLLRVLAAFAWVPGGRLR